MRLKPRRVDWWLLVAGAIAVVVGAAFVLDRSETAFAVLALMATSCFAVLGLVADRWLREDARLREPCEIGQLTYTASTVRIIPTTEIYLDALTTTYNRRALDRLMLEMCTDDQISFDSVVLMLIDLDNLKRINDQYGHLAGDSVLQALARRWQGMLRETDFLCRFGGDEFFVLLSNITAAQAEIVAQKLLDAARDPCMILDRDLVQKHVELSVSIGLIRLNRDVSADSERLLAAADRALYAAKHAGGNRMCWAS